MIHLILVNPEIPPNTGNIIRLCANIGAHLHLVRPLGFALSDAGLRRAGLDYRQMANVAEHNNYAEATAAINEDRLFALAPAQTDAIGGECRYDKLQYQKGDGFVFGCESLGLPDDILHLFPARRRLYIPMRPGNRSINLSNTAAIVAMEVWRQLQFDGAKE